MLGHLSCREVVCADVPLFDQIWIWYLHRRRSKWLVMWYITSIHPLSRIFGFILCRAHRVKGRNEHIPRFPLWSHMGYCSYYCNYCSQETLVCKNEKNYCLLLLHISLNLRQDYQMLFMFRSYLHYNGKTSWFGGDFNVYPFLGWKHKGSLSTR